MKRKICLTVFTFFLFLLSLLLLFPLSGCWDSTDIENRAFAVAIGIDSEIDSINESQDRFIFFATLANPSDLEDGAADSENNAPSATGQTVVEAITTLDVGSSSELFLGQVKTIVLGKNLLEDPDLFREAIGTIENHDEIDKTITVIAANSIPDILTASSQNTPKLGYNAVNAVNFYRIAPKSGGRSFHKTFNDMTTELRASGNTLLPFVQEIQEDRKNVKNNNDGFRVNGALAIKDYQLVGELDGNQLRGLLWATNKACEGAILTTEDHVPMVVRHHRSNLHFSEESGNLRCIIDIRIKGEISHYEIDPFQNGITPQDNSLIDRALNEEYRQIITMEIDQAIQKLQHEFELDSFNFKKSLRKQKYSLYQRYSNDWNQAFINMEIIPVVHCITI